MKHLTFTLSIRSIIGSPVQKLPVQKETKFPEISNTWEFHYLQSTLHGLL